MRYIQTVHALPGRTRLRCPALRHAVDDANRLADALAAVPGVHEASIRPYTGSILVVHEPSVASATLLDIVQRELTCDCVVGHGDQPPEEGPVPELSRIAKLTAAAFRDIDRDVRRASEGRHNLGTLVTVGLLGAGVLGIVSSREIRMPQWFNFAWWSYRTFMTNAQAEIASLRAELESLTHPAT